MARKKDVQEEETIPTKNWHEELHRHEELIDGFEKKSLGRFEEAPTHLPSRPEELLEELEKKSSGKRNKPVRRQREPNVRASKKSKKKSFLSRLFTKILLWLLLVAVILVGGYFLWQKVSQVQVEKKYALVTQELQRCSELTTVKVSYSDIVTLKKTAVLGMAKSYSIVKFSGVIRCGIENLGNCRMFIDEDGKGIVLRIPPATVLGNDIQEISVFDEQQSIFVPISTQEVLDQVELAREDTLRKALDSGMLADSEQQARALLTTILTNMGFQRINIQN